MNVVEIIFSPTGGTEKAAHIIGEHWSKDTVRIDLCDKKIDFAKCNIAKKNGFDCNAFIWRPCSRCGDRAVGTD